LKNLRALLPAFSVSVIVVLVAESLSPAASPARRCAGA
jgi:hypothetical protein